MEMGASTNDKQSDTTSNEINLFDLLVIMLERKRLILGLTLGLTMLSLIICLVVRPNFQASARILIPKSTNSVSSVMSQLGGAASALTGLSDLFGSSTVDMYIALARSSTVLDVVIAQFKLMELYKVDKFLGKWRSYTHDDCRDDLSDLLITEGDSASNLITISVNDKDPVRSAAMANTIVDQLILLVNNLSMTDGSRRKLFFEKQLNSTKEALAKVEDQLQGFQESTGAIKIDDQAIAILQGIANLQAQIGAKTIQLEVMKSYSTKFNPNVKLAEAELSALKDQFKKLQEKSATDSPNVMIPTDQIPGLGTEYFRILREFKFQEAMLEVILKQYEAASLDASRDSSVVQVVDRAVPPENINSPKWLLIVIIVGVLSFFMAAFGALMLGSIQRFTGSGKNTSKVADIISNLKRI